MSEQTEQPTDKPGGEHSRKNANNLPLPLWARLTIFLGLLGLLFFNVFTKGDSALSLLITAGLFAAVGIDANARNNRGGA